MSAPMAYEQNGARIGREAFYAIACDPRRSVAVEACAGAGKTWMLVSRILRALLAGAQPQEILAITFTKKAAGEMRNRLFEWLSEFSDCPPEKLREALELRGIAKPSGSDVEALRGLYARLLASGRPVQVRTFHSWFAALLRNAPLAVMEELGLPANYELLEDDSEAVELVWRRFHTAVAADASLRSDYESSVAAHGRSQTRKSIESALARRLEFGFADGAGVVERSVEPFASQFPEFAVLAEPCEALTQAPSIRQSLYDAARALGRGAPSFAQKGAQLERAVTEGDLDGAFDALLTKDGGPRKFSDKLEGIAQVRAAQETVLRLAAACAQHDAWLHQQRMARLARIAIACLQSLKRERGWVDMNDVERAALKMLADPVLSGWVQERLDARVRHLLIDEFQDTNPLQWQALSSWLSSYAGAGGDAPGVFIVGDPKQSIYRFRRAEAQVFAAAQAFIAEAFGGDRLSCDHTRRNSPAVLECVNAVMNQAQDEGLYAGFRSHTTESSGTGAVLRLPRIARDAIARPAAEEHAQWRDSLSVPRETPDERLVTLECRQAARWIAQAIAAGTPASQIMVLARRRERLAVMESQLRELRIPADQPEKTDLCEAPEVMDLVALLDVLVSTTHDLSLARALKSPLFGFGDDALVQIAMGVRQIRVAEGRSISWFDYLQHASAGPLLRAAGERLSAWKQLVETLPPHDALSLIYSQADVLARFGAAAPAPLRNPVLARLRALLGAALDWNGGRYSTPYAFVRAMKAGGMRAPAARADGAVNLVTVHGAKGLEAEVVLLLDCDPEPPRSETMGVLVDWPGEKPAPERLSFVASEKNPPPCTADALALEQSKRTREELNVLYVAMTRAIGTLVISSVEPYRANPGSWWERIQRHALPLEAGNPENSVAADEADGFVLMHVPLLPKRSPVAAPSEESLVSRIGQAMHRLLEICAASAPSPRQVQRVAREFALAPEDAARAAEMARRIVAGEAAWAWDSREVDWHANEVPLQHEGELLRIDRLVRRASTSEWWVLDYKSAARVEGRAELLAQMHKYRAAVSAIHPRATVRAALLTSDGRAVVVP